MSVIPTIQLLLRIAALGFEELPVAPHAVDHSVMNIDAWGGKGIPAGVAAGGERKRCQIGVRSAGIELCNRDRFDGDYIPDDIVAAAVRADFGHVGHSFEEVAVGGYVGVLTGGLLALSIEVSSTRSCTEHDNAVRP